MASKQTYECYVCKRNGHGDVRVYLDGKTDDGKTIYKNIDMSPHVHKPQQQQEKGSSNVLSTVTAESTSLKVINAKLDRIITLLTEPHQQRQKQQPQE